MPSVLTAIPFVATHQLVIFGVGCVFGHQFGGEAARSRQPVARRLGEMVRGDAREIGGRDAVALARGIDRGGDIAELPAALADRPIFERLGDACDVRKTATLGDQPEQAERSEDHTSELQSLMRKPYAIYCFNKKN